VRWPLALAAVALASGCALGAGSAYVGQWRPRTKIALSACRVDDAGRCVEHHEVIEPVPARTFWGVLATFPVFGMTQTSQGGVPDTRLRLESTLEVMKGYGRFAVGVRTGVQGDLAGTGKDGRFDTTVPVAVLGHLSILDRLAVYAGGGYVPWAQVDHVRSHVGATGIAGLQYAAHRDLEERYVILSLEANTTWVDLPHPYRSTALTGTVGIFF
jgi:hypothetical protein